MAAVAMERGSPPRPGPLWMCGREEWVLPVGQRGERDKVARRLRWRAEAIAERLALDRSAGHYGETPIKKYQPLKTQSSVRAAFWIDSSRLYMTSWHADGPHKADVQATGGPSTIWNVASGTVEVSEAIPPSAKILCSFDGSVRYAVEQKDGRVVEFWGKIGEAREVRRSSLGSEKDADVAEDYDRLTCAQKALLQGEEVVRTLLPEHGAVVIHGENPEFLAIKDPDGGSQSFPIPHRFLGDVIYLPYLDSYYFPPNRYIRSDEESLSGWRYLYKSKEFEEVPLRRGAWGRIYGNFLPTKNGLIIWSMEIGENDGGVGAAGVYLLSKDGHAKRVITAFPEVYRFPVASPDGCHFVFYVHERPDAPSYEIWVVDVCGGHQQ